jgi:SAM-dependent methyltransferase
MVVFRDATSSRFDLMSRRLDDLYTRRFRSRDALAKDAIWRELGRYLGDRFVPRGGAVLDLACDQGYFIRHVSAAERWASDIRDVSRYLPDDVHFVQEDGIALASVLPAAHFDTVFMSNYLEHLPSAEAVVEQFGVVKHLLKPGGVVVVLQPNIRLVGGAYWDFIDHKVALTDRSLREAAEATGLRTRDVVVRFLPYTTKSRLPQHAFLVRAYLRARPLWLLLGKQTLYVGEKA